MLSVEENWQNIWAISHLTRTRVIPIQIDRGTGKIRVLKDIKTLLTWSAYLAAVQLHSFYSLFCAVKVLGQGLKGTKSGLSYHYYKIFVPQCSTLLAVVPFLIQPEVFAALFNNAIGAAGNEKKSNKRKQSRRKPRRKFFNLSYHEMLTVLLPIASFPVGLLLLAGVTVVDFWPVTLHKLLTVSCLLKILVDGVVIFS